MNSPESFRVSIVADAASTETKDADAAEIICKIRDGMKRAAVETTRDTFSRVLAETGDLKAAKRAVDPLKKKLPGVLWSGRFSSREKPAAEKLIAHSGLLCADLDNLGGRLAQVRAKLATSPHLFALFTSPTGYGLKAIFRVPAEAERHTGSFRAVEKHVHDLTGEAIDGSCKDVARLCFVSYDADALLNQDAVELLPLVQNGRPVPPIRTASATPEIETRRRIVVELLGATEWTTDTRGFVTCPGQHLHMTSNGERDCEVHLDGAPTIHCFHNSCSAIRDAVNRELRSRIGKTERMMPRLRLGRTGSVASEYLSTDSLPLDVLPYTPPPLHLLPSELQDYVLAASESLAVDVSYILLPVLSAMGTAIGDSRVIQLKPGFVQPPVIWTNIIGRSGAKKSPALDEGTFAIRERERAFIRDNRSAAQEHEMLMADWEAASRKERGIKPVPPPRLTALLDDLTLAGLALALVENPRGLLVKKDELSHWFESFDQFTKAHGADVSRWLSLHTGVLFAYDRKTDRERHRLFNPRVCIAGGIQPKTLRRCLTEDFFDRGLPARFLFACPPGQQDRWTEKTVPSETRAAALGIFNHLFGLVPEESPDAERKPKVVTLDADAKAAFVAFYNSVGADAADADEREEAAWHKLTGYGARLALLGELARRDAERISGSVMQAATELARWFGAESKRSYALLAESPATAALRRLCEFISRSGGVVTVRDVTHCYRPLRSQTNLAENQLNQLVVAGLGEWMPMSTSTKGGRPTRQFRLIADNKACPRHQNPEIPLETESFGDGDKVESVQNTAAPKPDEQPELAEAMLL